MADAPPGNSLAAHYAERAEALTAQQTPRLRDVEYAPGRLLDVYGDAAAESLLLFFHGGGYTHGSKQWTGFVAPTVAPSALVAASYRLQPSATLADQQKDAAAALAWVRANCAASRVFVGGHSAGAALAALLALHDRTIAGAICISASFAQFAVTGTSAATYELPQGALQLDPRAPLAQVGTAKVPFLIAWGGRERQLARVERSSMQMIGALRDRNVAVDWLKLDQADHFETHLALTDPAHALSVALRAFLAQGSA